MRYSSRKLSNGKVIATACNFWRQIACSFKVMSRNILILGKKIFEIAPFSQTRPGDLGKKVHACSLCFSALKKTCLWCCGSALLSLKCSSLWSSAGITVRCSGIKKVLSKMRRLAKNRQRDHEGDPQCLSLTAQMASFFWTERAWYFICQPSWKSVNIEKFDQSERDTRIWYHEGMSAGLPPFLPPQSTTRLASLAKFFFPVSPALSFLFKMTSASVELK